MKHTNNQTNKQLNNQTHTNKDADTHLLAVRVIPGRVLTINSKGACPSVRLSSPPSLSLSLSLSPYQIAPPSG